MRSFRLYSNIPALPGNKIWAEIDEKALINNYALLCEKTPDVKHICVVKADSYGHASAICVSALLDAGCDFFAVSCIEEAIEVRRLCSIRNTDAKVLILGYTDPRYVRQLAEYNVIQTVVDEDHAKALEDAARLEDCKVQVHIALDTGMNRIGLCARNEKECEAAVEAVKRLVKSSNLAVEGMFTHFAKADEEDSAVFAPDSATKAQFELFKTVRNALKDSGIKLFCHVCNSAAAVRFPEFALDGVRLGILLYGVRPSSEMTAETKPVMSLRTVISHVHPLAAGDKVSYGGKYEADSDKTIATLPIGINRFLNSDCCCRRNHIFKFRQNLFAVHIRNLFIRKCNLTHIITDKRLVNSYCFQISGHKQKAIDRRRLILKLRINHSCINMSNKRLALHQGFQFLICFYCCIT